MQTSFKTKNPDVKNASKLDVVYSKNTILDKKISKTNTSVKDLLSSKDMTKFLSIIGYSKKDAESVLTNEWKNICSNVDFIVNGKEFEVKIKKDVINTVYLICAMTAILEKRLGLDKIGINQNDILSIISIESKFDKNAGYNGAYGLFQITLSTIKDTLENFSYIKSDINTISNVSCFDISKIDVNEKNYSKNLLDISNSMAFLGLVLFRKYKIALQEARDSNENSKYTKSSLYGGSKIYKKNILYKKTDPRLTKNYQLDDEQKKILFADYFNASADLRKIKDYGEEYLEHALLLDNYLNTYVFSK